MRSTEMRAYRPPEAGMPFGIALAWAVVDLHLAFGFRLTQLALETPLEWRNVFTRRDVSDSEESYDQEDTDRHIPQCVS